MTRNRLLLIAGIVVALGAASWLYFRSGRENVAIDLMKEFPTAKDPVKDRRPSPEAFTVVDAKIAGETKRSIFTKDYAGTRVIWHETIPDNAWLKVDLGLLEEAWTMKGDGVLFRVGISDGKTYDELLNVMINPFGNPGDRKWTNVTLDLSQYAGEAVDVIFNTNSSAPGHDDRNGDLAVWGAPRIIVR